MIQNRSRKDDVQIRKATSASEPTPFLGTFFSFVLMLTMLCTVGVQSSWAEFKDFAIVLNDQSGTLLTADERNSSTRPLFRFGITVNDGTTERVAFEDPSAIATVTGQYHNDHGSNGIVVTIPNVTGIIKVTLGNCQYSEGIGTVKQGTTTLATIAHGTKNATSPNCYEGDNEHNVTSAYVFIGNTPQEIKVNTGEYCGLVKVEQCVYKADDINTYVGDPSPTLNQLKDGATFNLTNYQVTAGAATMTWGSEEYKYCDMKKDGVYQDQVPFTCYGQTFNYYLQCKDNAKVGSSNVTENKIPDNGGYVKFTSTENGIITLVAHNFSSDASKQICIVKDNGDGTGTGLPATLVGDGTDNQPFVSGGAMSGYTGGIKFAVKADEDYYVYKTNASKLQVYGFFFQQAESHTVTFDKPAEANGVLPAQESVIDGNKIILPVNRQLYREGYTLTGWSDGANTYKPGDEYTVNADVTLTAVFTENTVNLADRLSPVTVMWDFQRKNGAPTLASENETDKFYVTQATVNGKTIDVKLDYRTDNSGKIANGNWTDWCQMNAGTTFTLPSCKGATFSMEGYNQDDKSTTFATVDGTAITYASAVSNIISQGITNNANTVDVVVGRGSYYRWLQMVLPVVVAPDDHAGREVYKAPAPTEDQLAKGKTNTGYTDIPTTGSTPSVTLFWGPDTEYKYCDLNADVSTQASFTFDGDTFNWYCQSNKSGAKNGTNYADANSLPDNGSYIKLTPTKSGMMTVVIHNLESTTAKPLLINEVDGGGNITHLNADLVGDGSQHQSYISGTTVVTKGTYSGGVQFPVTAGKEYYVYRAGNTKVQFYGYIFDPDKDVIPTEETLLYHSTFSDWEKKTCENGVKYTVNQNTFQGNPLTFSLLNTNIKDATQSNFASIGVSSETPRRALVACKNDGGEKDINNEDCNKDPYIITSTIEHLTKVKFLHGATASNRGWKLDVSTDDGETWTSLSNKAIPSNNYTDWVEVSNLDKHNCKLRWTNLAAKQNAYLFEVELYGTSSGYILATTADPSGRGTVTRTPDSPVYTKGTQITLTATPAEGYDFVNWTDDAGVELSTESNYTYTMPGKSTTVTANFRISVSAVFDGGFSFGTKTAGELNHGTRGTKFSFKNMVDGATAYVKIDDAADYVVYQEDMAAMQNVTVKVQLSDGTWSGEVMTEAPVQYDLNKKFVAWVYNAAYNAAAHGADGDIVGLKLKEKYYVIDVAAADKNAKLEATCPSIMGADVVYFTEMMGSGDKIAQDAQSIYDAKIPMILQKSFAYKNFKTGSTTWGKGNNVNDATSFNPADPYLKLFDGVEMTTDESGKASIDVFTSTGAIMSYVTVNAGTAAAYLTTIGTMNVAGKDEISAQVNGDVNNPFLMIAPNGDYSSQYHQNFATIISNAVDMMLAKVSLTTTTAGPAPEITETGKGAAHIETKLYDSEIYYLDYTEEPGSAPDAATICTTGKTLNSDGNTEKFAADHVIYAVVKYDISGTPKYSAVATKTISGYTKRDVMFQNGDGDNTPTLPSILPASLEQTIGADYTLPANTGMYKAGYTLSSWSIQQKDYKGANVGDAVVKNVGEKYTMTSSDVVLTPIYKKVTLKLAESKTSEMAQHTATYNFDAAIDNAPEERYYVTQVTLTSQDGNATEMMDVPLHVLEDASASLPAVYGMSVTVTGGSGADTYNCTDRHAETLKLDNIAGATSITVVYPQRVGVSLKVYYFNGESASEDADKGTIAFDGDRFFSVGMQEVITAQTKYGFDFKEWQVIKTDESVETPAGVNGEHDFSSTLTFSSTAADIKEIRAVFKTRVTYNVNVVLVDEGGNDMSSAAVIRYTTSFLGEEKVLEVDGSGVVKAANSTDVIATLQFVEGEGYFVKEWQDADGNKITDSELINPMTISVDGEAVTYKAVINKNADGFKMSFDMTSAIDDEGNKVAISSDFIMEPVTTKGRYTFPLYYNFYAEGYSLKGWQDERLLKGRSGAEPSDITYLPGQTIYPAEALTLVPVFSKNPQYGRLDGRSETVNLEWKFAQNAGAQSMQYGNGKSLQLAANARVITITGGDHSIYHIDVPMSINTGVRGRIDNTSSADWCTMTQGTTLTVPACKGATIELDVRSQLSTTTFGGVVPTENELKTDYYTYSYTVEDDCESLDIVLGDDYSYYKAVRVNLPPAQRPYEITYLDTDFSPESLNKYGFSNGTFRTDFTRDLITVSPEGWNISRDSEGYYVNSNRNPSEPTFTLSGFKSIARIGSRIEGGWRIVATYTEDGEEKEYVITDEIREPNLQWYDRDVYLLDKDNITLKVYCLDTDKPAKVDVFQVYGIDQTTNLLFRLNKTVYPLGTGETEIHPFTHCYPKQGETLEFEEDTSVRLIARPTRGFVFDYWQDVDMDPTDPDSHISTDADWTFNIKRHMNVRAVFKAVGIVAFGVGSSSANGVAPASVESDENGKFEIPVNTTLSRAGTLSTLQYWYQESAPDTHYNTNTSPAVKYDHPLARTYTYPAESDPDYEAKSLLTVSTREVTATLYPMFQDNTIAVAETDENLAVTWDLTNITPTKDGAAAVTQANVNGHIIDVQATIRTDNVLILPYSKGMEVTVTGTTEDTSKARVISNDGTIKITLKGKPTTVSVTYKPRHYEPVLSLESITAKADENWGAADVRISVTPKSGEETPVIYYTIDNTEPTTESSTVALTGDATKSGIVNVPFSGAGSVIVRTKVITAGQPDSEESTLIVAPVDPSKPTAFYHYDEAYGTYDVGADLIYEELMFRNSDINLVAVKKGTTISGTGITENVSIITSAMSDADATALVTAAQSASKKIVLLRDGAKGSLVDGATNITAKNLALFDYVLYKEDAEAAVNAAADYSMYITPVDGQTLKYKDNVFFANINMDNIDILSRNAGAIVANAAIMLAKGEDPTSKTAKANHVTNTRFDGGVAMNAVQLAYLANGSIELVESRYTGSFLKGVSTVHEYDGSGNVTETRNTLIAPVGTQIRVSYTAGADYTGWTDRTYIIYNSVQTETKTLIYSDAIKEDNYNGPLKRNGGEDPVSNANTLVLGEWKLTDLSGSHSGQNGERFDIPSFACYAIHVPVGYQVVNVEFFGNTRFKLKNMTPTPAERDGLPSTSRFDFYYGVDYAGLSEEPKTYPQPDEKDWTDYNASVVPYTGYMSYEIKHSYPSDIIFQHNDDFATNVSNDTKNNAQVSKIVLTYVKVINDNAPILQSVEKTDAIDGITKLKFDVAMKEVTEIDGAYVMKSSGGKKQTVIAEGGSATLQFAHYDLEPETNYELHIPYSALVNYDFQTVVSEGGKADGETIATVGTDEFIVPFKTGEAAKMKHALFNFITDDVNNNTTWDGTFYDAVNAIGNAEIKEDERMYVYVANSKAGDEFGYNLTPDAEKNDGNTTFTKKTNLTGDNGDTRFSSKNNLSIIGESRDKVVISSANIQFGSSKGGTFAFNLCDNLYMQDLTIYNYYEKAYDHTGQAQAPALELSWTDRTIFKNVRMKSLQDTWSVENVKRGYYEDCIFMGTTDFLCGDGSEWFENCELILRNRSSVNITAPRTKEGQWGYIFNNSAISRSEDASAVTDYGYTIGRPWDASPACTFLNTTMNVLPALAGWTNMEGGRVIRFHEYGSVDMNGDLVDLTYRSIDACAPADGSDAPVLTEAQAKRYSVHRMLGGDDAWDPDDQTAQQEAVTDLNFDGYNLSWKNDNTALGYMVYYLGNGVTADYSDPMLVANVIGSDEADAHPIFNINNEDGANIAGQVKTFCKDGKNYAFIDWYKATNGVDFTSGWFAIRSANQMGGLGEFSEAIQYHANRTYKANIGSSGKANGDESGNVWSTVYLDFNALVPRGVKAYALTGVTAYGEGEVEETTVTLQHVSSNSSTDVIQDVINANQGYVLYGPGSTIYEFVESGQTSLESYLDGTVGTLKENPVDAKTIYVNGQPVTYSPEPVDYDNMDIGNISCYTLATRTATGNEYGLGFYKYGGTTLGHHKAYLDTEKANHLLELSGAGTGVGAKAFRVVIVDGEVTTIYAVTIDGITKTDGHVYNIAGQRINPQQMRKGEIYIIGGKKIRY